MKVMTCPEDTGGQSDLLLDVVNNMKMVQACGPVGLNHFSMQ
jgi:hypothetical protein